MPTQQSCDVTFFLNDVHIPYEDPKAVRVALSLMEHMRPTHVFLNGDILDCPQLSKFDKDPGRLLRLQDDLTRLGKFLAAVRAAAPDAQITYLEGNHEHRLTRYLWQHPEISGLQAMQPENLFRLGDHSIAWMSQNDICQHRGFVVAHGSIVRQHAGYSAKGQFDKYNCSGISGHTHRVGAYRRRTLSGEYIWYENGCLCGLRPKYMVGPADWQHAVAVGRFIRGDRRFQIEQIQIVKGKALYGDLLFD